MIPAIYNLSLKREFEEIKNKIYSNIIKMNTKTNTNLIIERSADTFILDSIKIQNLNTLQKIELRIGGHIIWSIDKETLVTLSKIQKVRDGIIIRFNEEMLCNEPIPLISCQYMDMRIKIYTNKEEDAIVYIKNFYHEDEERQKLATNYRTYIIQQYQRSKRQNGSIWKPNVKFQCHGFILDVTGLFNEILLKVTEFNIIKYDIDDLNYYGKLLKRVEIDKEQLRFLNKFIPDDVVNEIYEYTDKIYHKFWIPFHPKNKINNYKTHLTTIDFTKTNEAEIKFDREVTGNVTFINYNVLINQTGMMGVFYS